MNGSKQLLRRAQRGDARAIEALVELWWPVAYRTAYAIVGPSGHAEDVAQESVLAAVRALRSFDRSRPVAPWLNRIVANRALDSLRVTGRRSEVTLAEIPSEVAIPEPDGISDELMQALLTLEPRDRAIVVLRHLVGFGSGEIAEMLDTKPGTVRSALHRSLSSLRDQLDPAYPVPERKVACD